LKSKSEKTSYSAVRGNAGGNDTVYGKVVGATSSEGFLAVDGDVWWQGYKSGARSEARRSNAATFAASYRQHRPHLLHVLHRLRHSRRPGMQSAIPFIRYKRIRRVRWPT